MEQLKNIKNKKGRKTELVTLTIPKGYRIEEAINLIKKEQAEAENIQRKNTRKNVKSALKKIEKKLKEIGTTPKNGAAIYAGNISEQGGKTDVNIWTVIPENNPIKQKLYSCDKKFRTEPVENALSTGKKIGIVTIDYNEYTIATITDTGNIDIKTEFQSNVPNKHKKGGQSQQRYERFRESRIKTFLTKAAEQVKQTFHRDENIQGVILAGPGQVKNKLQKELHNDIKIITTEDVGYTGPEGVRRTAQKSRKIRDELQYVDETRIVNKFFENIGKDNGLAEYGSDAVEQAASIGAVETLLVPGGEDV